MKVDKSYMYNLHTSHVIYCINGALEIFPLAVHKEHTAVRTELWANSYEPLE